MEEGKKPETVVVNNYNNGGTTGGATVKKNWTVALLLSIFLGGLGVDRFYLGETGVGVAKLLLGWLTFGIWWLVDVIRIATKSVKGIEWE